MNKRGSVYDDFCKEYGSDMAENIFLTFYGDIEPKNISIWGVNREDAVNAQFMATISDSKGNELCSVSCRDGNWMGSEILEYGDIGEPDRFQVIRKLEIADRILMGDPKKLENSKNIFSFWKKQEWFSEMEGKISYDLHSDPSSKTRKYWNEKAEKKGLKIVTEVVRNLSC